MISLADANHQINETCTYAPDQAHYGQAEYWESAANDHIGDCEDFAIAKMRLLLANGWSREQLKLGLCWVETGEYHCVLTAMEDGQDWALDNRYPHPIKWQDLPYRWHKFYLLGEREWRLYGD